MGVFTTSKQFALEIDMPGWWLAGSSVDMDFVHGRYYDSSLSTPAAVGNLLSISRASIGYAKTSAGTLTQFASGQLRTTDLGLLIEDARTNNAVGNPASTSYWPSSNVTPTNNSIIGPDGTTTGILMTASGAGAASSTNDGTAGTFAATSPTAYTFSAYFKVGLGADWCAVQCLETVNFDSFYAFFNVRTGAVGLVTGSGAGVADSTNVETLSNGWYRFSVTGHFTSTPPNNICANLFFCCPTSSATTPATASDFQYVWGPQAEIGSFASSYIPTTTTSATRAADAVKAAGNLNALLTVLPHSEVIDLIMLGPPANPTGICSDDSAAVRDLYSNGNNSQVQYYAGGSGAFASFPTALYTTGVKVGVGIASGAVSLVGNAGAIGTYGSPAAMSSGNVGIGSSGVSERAYAYIRRLTAWNNKLADATLQALTNP